MSEKDTSPSSEAVTEQLPPDQNHDPAATYATRLEACQAEAKRRRRQHILFGYVRLVWVSLFLLLAWLAFAHHRLGWGWLLLPFLAFAVTTRFHSVVIAAGARSQRAIAWYEHGLARIEDRWAGVHPRTTRVEASESLFAADLDLFGPQSLFELLCTARSTLGEDTLAGWLLHPAKADEVKARQAAVADLRSRTALREAIASAPGPETLILDQNALAGWGEARIQSLPTIMRWLAPALAVLTLAAVVYWATGHSSLFVTPLLLVNASLAFLFERRLKLLFTETQRAAGKLALLADLLARIEAEGFTAPRLQAAKATLLSAQATASKATRRLASLSAIVEQRSNYILRLLEIILLPSTHLGLAVQAWKQQYGTHLRAWLACVGEFEAMLSLSAYHFEHPADPFPALVSGDGLFLAEELGHPLLPQANCVRNSVSLDRETRLLLVSGSNMSGKSTLLRSVGTAAVMAMAGAPIRAQSLRLSALHVAASIQVSDSLQSGRSRFYAEILRLRAVCAMAHTQPPVLFLLDELLAGTNSSDRLAGAQGVIRELLGAGALGLLSTHDLALTELGGPEAQRVRNAHFEDQVIGDQLRFDHRLRAGTVTRSNGLALMRMIGLDV